MKDRSMNIDRLKRMKPIYHIFGEMAMTYNDYMTPNETVNIFLALTKL